MTDIELVPLALLAAEIGQTIDDLARLYEPELVRDDLGLRCIPAALARQAIDERDARLLADAKTAARNQAILEAVAAQTRVIPVGVPALEGLTPTESMRAVPGYTSVNDELGRPRPNWLDDELAESQRQLNESRRP